MSLIGKYRLCISEWRFSRCEGRLINDNLNIGM